MIVPFDLLSIFVGVAWCCHILSPIPIRIRRPWQQLETQRLFSRLSPVRSIETVRFLIEPSWGSGKIWQDMARFKWICVPQMSLTPSVTMAPMSMKIMKIAWNFAYWLTRWGHWWKQGAGQREVAHLCGAIQRNHNKSVFLIIALLPPPSTVALIIVGSSNPHPKAMKTHYLYFERKKRSVVSM